MSVNQKDTLGQVVARISPPKDQYHEDCLIYTSLGFSDALSILKSYDGVTVLADDAHMCDPFDGSTITVIHIRCPPKIASVIAELPMTVAILYKQPL